MKRPRASKGAPIVDQAEPPWVAGPTLPKYRWRSKALGQVAGSQKLGCTLMELPGGAHSWPVHFHTANEEAIYVLEGSGVLRLGETEHPVSVGDYIALLPGEQNAHQMANDSPDEVLRYLCFSTMVQPDIVVYPESGKVGLFIGAAPGEKGFQDLVRFVRDEEVDYWEDEG
jgi:uncharacterized cupin superfamily protein